MNRRALPFFMAALACAAVPSAQVTTKRIAAGLERPLWAGAPEGDPRVFIAEKGGRIKVLQNGQVLATLFLDLSTKVSLGSEQGLLGIAFHPSYGTNGRFYVNYTDLAGDTVVARFLVTSDPNVADPASESLVIAADQPFHNHNGGDLHFGPDGYLYVFMGDGGSGYDPRCRAQKATSLLGKVLRLDVDSATPYAIPPDNPLAGFPALRQEIFHYGLRNPWRNGFDRLTGDLFIGDVGQQMREEIDVAPAGSRALNFGWKTMEGTLCTNNAVNCPPTTPGCNDPSLVRPIVELLQSDGAAAITGGYVYRGWACPSEFGRYFFADYGDAKIRSLVYDRVAGTISDQRDRTAELAPGGGLDIRSIASFGEDGFGELLILDHSSSGNGEVYKMVPAGAPAASNTVRNGAGGNRLCLSATSLPILGNRWEARVDASAHPGATSVFLFGYTAASSGTFFGPNEILVDAASFQLFQFVEPAASSVVFRARIPCSSALAGISTHVQALILGGSVELCNALELVTGYY